MIGFLDHATDWKSVCAITAGSLAYRFGRIGLSSGTAVQGFESVRRIACTGTALAAEVATFEATHRSLQNSSPHLWKWNGVAGLKNGFLTSFTTFGALKGAGAAAQGQNLAFQHLLQDTAMVLGHQISARLGFTPLPEGTLAEQFLHAEATNLQIGAGMALGHAMTSGRVMAVERGLDLSLGTQIPPTPLFQRGASDRSRGDFALAAGISELPPRLEAEKPETLHISAMSGRSDSRPRFLVSPIADLRAKVLQPLPKLGGRLSEAKAQVLREKFLGRFPEADKSHSEEIIDSILSVPEYSIEFHPRLLEAFAQAPNSGTVEQLYTAKAVEHVFKCDSLNTNTGSFENARLQYLIDRSVAEDNPVVRLGNLLKIFEAMEKKIDSLKVDGLFGRLGLGQGLSVKAPLYEIPFSFSRQGEFQIHRLEGTKAQIFVNPEGRWGIQNISHDQTVWLVERGDVRELKPGEHAPLLSDAEFMIGKDFDTANGYTLRQNEKGPPSLMAGLTPLQLLYSNAGAGDSNEKRTQALYAYEYAHTSGLYDPKDLNIAFDFARRHPQGRLALTRLLHVFYAKDVPAKVRELRFDTREDTLDYVTSLHRQGLPPQEIAEKINGTHHTAYMQDIRVARKLVSVLLDVGPYLLNPVLIREKEKQLESAFMAVLTHQEVTEGVGVRNETLAERIGVDELIEIMKATNDPFVQAFLADWSERIFRLRLTKPETIVKLIQRMPEKDSDPGTALFIPADPANENDLVLEQNGGPVRLDRKMDTLLIQYLPDFLLKTEPDLQAGFREVKEEIIRSLHEGDHQRSSSGRYHGIETGGEPINYLGFNKIDREARLVSEIMGNLEDNRWIFKHDGIHFLEIGQRLGKNLVFWWRDENDRLYFDALNRRLSEGKAKP